MTRFPYEVKIYPDHNMEAGSPETCYEAWYVEKDPDGVDRIDDVDVAWSRFHEMFGLTIIDGYELGYEQYHYEYIVINDESDEAKLSAFLLQYCWYDGENEG